ncbi:carboxypeptidase regulatory-like domain-containing protein [Blastopirellula marina]|uniref:Carboxypeptidase regulatory-like domain-containing protein n=1 Tax=Blastopirellula marina TaxID=124 RepID=A0A2S8GFU7_9BACT|nr:carboxypeptidase regulatory-like domain-containing protein [Blastopirellula marina]PQO43358.1 hypothetical protein C5Y98_00135 [Blastopirellula marina]PTL46672.1 carboxypeptidase regulatory-like domain-containing protein [Blastopirellula marina]
MHQSFYSLALLTSLVAVGVCGCFGGNGATEPVQGTVTYNDGTPVKGGTIVFAAVESNSSSVGYIQEDGTYVLGTFGETDGAPKGKYAVTVTGNSDYGQKSAVAPKFGVSGQSPLEAEVVSGSNTIDFQVDKAK